MPDQDEILICGVTDAEFARFAGVLCKWPRQDISYAITGWIPELTQSEYRATVRAAFDSWEAVCGIHADEVQSTNANILISAGRGRRSNFDGPSGVLAWCELPCGNPTQVRLLLDLDENWTTKLTGGSGQILVQNVLAHELGHGLGLEHITNAKALMNPTYDPKVPGPLAPDVAQVVLRYGASRPRTLPPIPTPTPTPVPTPGRTPIELTVGGKTQWKAFLEDLR